MHSAASLFACIFRPMTRPSPVALPLVLLRKRTNHNPSNGLKGTVRRPFSARHTELHAAKPRRHLGFNSSWNPILLTHSLTLLLVIASFAALPLPLASVLFACTPRPVIQTPILLQLISVILHSAFCNIPKKDIKRPSRNIRRIHSEKSITARRDLVRLLSLSIQQLFELLLLLLLKRQDSLYFSHLFAKSLVFQPLHVVGSRLSPHQLSPRFSSRRPYFQLLAPRVQ